MPLYLFIDILCILFPFLLSFERQKVHFRSQWSKTFKGILLMMLIFIPWDIIFTIYGFWGFNASYLSGLTIIQLPIEEWLFFICIGYACAFTHEVLKAYFPVITKIKAGVLTQSILAISTLAIALIFYDKWYTFTAFLSVSLFFGLSLWKKWRWVGTYWVSYTVILIPFFLINGWLTGSFTDEPIVWYNNQENLSIRLFTIPLEDLFYNFTMLGIIISQLEKK